MGSLHCSTYPIAGFIGLGNGRERERREVRRGEDENSAICTLVFLVYNDIVV